MRVLLLHNVSSNSINVAITYLRERETEIEEERDTERKTTTERYRSHRNPALLQVLLIEKPYSEI